MTAAEADAIGRGLRSACTPGRAAREKAYLKSDLQFAGTPAAAIRSVARAWSAARPDLDHGDLLAVTAALWAQPLFECRAAAVELLRHRPALLQAGDAGLAPRVHLASGITVREAVKPLPPGTGEMLMAGYRGKYPVTLPT